MWDTLSWNLITSTSEHPLQFRDLVEACPLFAVGFTDHI